MDRLPIDEQIEHAMARRAQMLKTHEVRASVPAAQWPAGRRFCSGCQFMCPLWYTQGSKCRACSSHASYSSHLAREYKISYDDYLAMLQYQGYRCYICRKAAPKRRLAVDHDHKTGQVRGLLCAGSDRGCNVMIGDIGDSVETARRIVLYLTNPPFIAMRSGEAMPAEVAHAGPKESTIMPTTATVGTLEIMAKMADEALTRQAKAAKTGHYSDGDFWRFPKDHQGPFDIFHAVPDITKPKLWERRLELARARQADIDRQRAQD